MSGIEALLAGRVLADRYHIEKVIGRGGMGAVYRAVDQRLGRPVAVKVIMVPTGDADQLERLRARFLREAQAAARLRHPNVVTVHDFGIDAELGLDYLVMELLEGEDLATRVARGGPLAPDAATDVLVQAARGVAVGHRGGLVHRDIKPGNLFLEQGEGRPEVRVLDFGIAQIALEDTFSHLTVAGRGPLSPAYASPEQLRGETRLPPASDVFSLGAVGLFTLTGERPFATPEARGEQHVVDAAVARLDSVPGMDPGLRAVLARALHPDAEARFPDANAFREALEAVRLGSTDDALRLAAATYAPVAVPVPPSELPDAGPIRAGSYAGDDATQLAPPMPGGADDVTQIGGLPPAPAPPPSAMPRDEVRSAAPPVLPAPPPLRDDVLPATPPRRRRRWVGPAAVGALALGAAAVFALQGGGDDDPVAPPVAVVDSTAQTDSLALADSTAREDSVRLAQAADSAAQARQRDQARRDSVSRLARARDSILSAPPARDTGLVRVGPSQPAPSSDRVFAQGEVDRAPTLRDRDDVARQLARRYPDAQRRAGVRGQALVRFVIGPNGRVDRGSINVASASDPAFAEAAREVVERLRFEPARKDGRNVAVRAELPLNWQ